MHKCVFKYVYLQETAEVEDSKTSTRGEGNEGRKWMNGRDGVGRFFLFFDIVTAEGNEIRPTVLLISQERGRVCDIYIPHVVTHGRPPTNQPPRRPDRPTRHQT